MKQSLCVVALFVATTASQAIAKEKPDPLCAPLQAFVESVKPDEHRELAFHTIWGAGFKGMNPETIYAKNCEHFGYAPADAACKVFMETGATEFSEINFKRAMGCLSPKTTFDPDLSVEKASVSFSYDSVDRGSSIKLSYEGDDERGGMVLRITANGY